MTTPLLHLLAGPNGAGKSTLHRSLVAPRYPSLPLVHPDLHQAQQIPRVASKTRRLALARAWADSERAGLLERRQSFVTESVFSHPSKLQLMAGAHARGFEIVLYVICLDDTRMLVKRARQKVREGGHEATDHKVTTRYPRTLTLLQEALTLADLSLLFDGSDSEDGGPKLIASIAAGRLHLHTATRPLWVEKVLGFAEG